MQRTAFISSQRLVGKMGRKLSGKVAGKGGGPASRSRREGIQNGKVGLQSKYVIGPKYSGSRTTHTICRDWVIGDHAGQLPCGAWNLVRQMRLCQICLAMLTSPVWVGRLAEIGCSFGYFPEYHWFAKVSINQSPHSLSFERNRGTGADNCVNILSRTGHPTSTTRLSSLATIIIVHENTHTHTKYVFFDTSWTHRAVTALQNNSNKRK
ncbi:hypothetical protein QBC38DRAFT_137743 [Podospora fimiseda]|uniref:Uncharacterized protein n=1 Tax=Podospora fimiseda TaxID=252190 RepID=A0AAN6YR39_9PEZI|nr:hypothetical protein QBC38DRAFT_137743 [Podospora fimiseda]